MAKYKANIIYLLLCIVIVLLSIVTFSLFTPHTHHEKIQNIEVINSTPDRRINIPTRGEAPPYTRIGILTKTTNEKNRDPKVLQVYGRPTYRGSDFWNYYASHDGVHIPIYNKGVNCDRPRGCDEIYTDGEGVVDMNAFESSYRLEIYKSLNGNVPPRYL